MFICVYDYSTAQYIFILQVQICEGCAMYLYVIYMNMCTGTGIVNMCSNDEYYCKVDLITFSYSHTGIEYIKHLII